MGRVAKNSKYFESLALSVAGGETIRDAAKEHGCSETHAYHISCSPEFKKRVNEVRAQTTARAVGKLTKASTEAIDTLLKLTGESNEPSIRLNASKAILASLGPISELAELRARLEELESQRERVRVVG